MIQLIISQVALCVGPVIYGWLHQRPVLFKVLDSVVLVSVSALVLLEIVPAGVAEAGPFVLVALVVGLLLPNALEQVLHKTESHTLENWTHKAALVAAISGLALHATLDGAGLASAMGLRSAESMLALAIVIHRLPVGLSIWWLLRPKFGRRTAMATLLGVVLATTIGYVAGNEVLSRISGAAVAWFQIFVAGSLLHVVFFQKHMEKHD